MPIVTLVGTSSIYAFGLTWQVPRQTDFEIPMLLSRKPLFSATDPVDAIPRVFRSSFFWGALVGNVSFFIRIRILA